MSKGKLILLNGLGDSTTTWDTEVEETVKAAEAIFRTNVIATGGRAFTVEADGKAGNLIRRFDPEAQEIVAFRQLAGG